MPSKIGKLIYKGKCIIPHNLPHFGQNWYRCGDVDCRIGLKQSLHNIVVRNSSTSMTSTRGSWRSAFNNWGCGDLMYPLIGELAAILVEPITTNPRRSFLPLFLHSSHNPLFFGLTFSYQNHKDNFIFLPFLPLRCCEWNQNNLVRYYLCAFSNLWTIFLHPKHPTLRTTYIWMFLLYRSEWDILYTRI